MGYLSIDQIKTYHDQGFLTIPQFADDATIEAMRQAATTIVNDFDMEEIRVFTTNEQTRHADQYFFDSADKVRCFFEEEAFDDKYHLAVAKNLAINKIGHALHDLHPIFEAYSYQSNLFDIAIDLGLTQPSIIQSQYIFKQPHIGGKVAAHTDSTFLYSDPMTCTGAWLALEDATEENGCLSFIAGSHREYPLQQLFIRNATNDGTEFVDTQAERVDWDLSQLQPLTAKKGDLVLLHGQVIHASSANRSAHSRHAYILHIIDQTAAWSPQNWLQRSTEMPLRTMKNVASLLNT